MGGAKWQEVKNGDGKARENKGDHGILDGTVLAFRNERETPVGPSVHQKGPNASCLGKKKTPEGPVELNTHEASTIWGKFPVERSGSCRVVNHSSRTAGFERASPHQETWNLTDKNPNSNPRSGEGWTAGKV